MRSLHLRLMTTAIIFILSNLLAVGHAQIEYNKSKKTDKKGILNKKNKTRKDKEKTKTKNALADKIKSCKKYPGFFTFYQDSVTGESYMLVKREQLERELLYFCYTENGLPELDHYRGHFRENRILKLRRYFNKIEFRAQNTAFYFDAKSPLARAADANISPAVLASMRVLAEDSIKGYMLISADTLLLHENLHQVKPSEPETPSEAKGEFKLGELSAERTKILRLRSYPQNSDVLVEYVYKNDAPHNPGGEDVTDARAVSLILQHSFIDAPPNDYKPRFADPRVGFFSNKIDDMTSSDVAPWRDVIFRWKLEKKDKNALISEPVEPITFWLENTTPHEFRETLKKAILAWNDAFEAAGFSNAVRVKIQPDTANWDAGDIRYNVIRWTSSPKPPFGGYGPTFYHPRTGQILGTDIMLEFVYLTNRLNKEKTFVGSYHDQKRPLNKKNPFYCSAGERLQHSLLFGAEALSALSESELDMTELLHQALTELVQHEVGHTLGLSHNMRASQLYSPQQLDDRNLTNYTGLVSSVMDYTLIHFSPDYKKQGLFFTTKPGPYDKWAIEFGYTPPSENETAEKQRMRRILDRSTEPALAFGDDADDMTHLGSGIDPRVMEDDISNDVITYSAERIKLAYRVMSRLKSRYIKYNQSYHELYNSFLIVSTEHKLAADAIARYIGGVYVDRAYLGQPGATQPFTPVPLDEQKRAMRALEEFVFSPGAFDYPEELLTHLQRRRRGQDFFGKAQDPEIHARVLGVQKGVLEIMLHPVTLKRVTDSRLYGNKYSVEDIFKDLTDAIFKSDISVIPNTFRRNIQIEYLKELIKIAGLNQKSEYDYIVQTASFQTILNLQRMLTSAPESAHKSYLQFTIQKALDIKNK